MYSRGSYKQQLRLNNVLVIIFLIRIEYLYEYRISNEGAKSRNVAVVSTQNIIVSMIFFIVNVESYLSGLPLRLTVGKYNNVSLSFYITTLVWLYVHIVCVCGIITALV